MKKQYCLPCDGITNRSVVATHKSADGVLLCASCAKFYKNDFKGVKKIQKKKILGGKRK